MSNIYHKMFINYRYAEDCEGEGMMLSEQVAGGPRLRIWEDLPEEVRYELRWLAQSHPSLDT